MDRICATINCRNAMPITTAWVCRIAIRGLPTRSVGSRSLNDQGSSETAPANPTTSIAQPSCRFQRPSNIAISLPGDLFGETGVESHARLPAKVALELARIGDGAALIAGPGRRAANLSAAADEGFELLQDVPHRRRLAATDVVDLAQGRAQGGHGRFHAVADIGVATYLQAVAEYRDGPAFEKCGNESVVAHVGPLPRTVNGEVAQHDQRKSVLFLMRTAQILAGQLGHAVGRNWPRGHRLVAGAVPAVDRRGRSVNEALHRWCLAHRLQQALRGRQVAALIEVEVGPALD